MTTQNHSSPAKAWQALTDQEILDDSQNYPVAKIKIRGVCTAEIRQVSEWHYLHVLVPYKEAVFNYYAQAVAMSSDGEDKDLILEKVKAFENLMHSGSEEEKSNTLISMFAREDFRRHFLKVLKKVKVIPWWVSFRRWTMKADPVAMPTLFGWLWLFNYDGVKKKLQNLLKRITQATYQDTVTDFNDSKTWESYKAKLQAAHDRVESQGGLKKLGE